MLTFTVSMTKSSFLFFSVYRDLLERLTKGLSPCETITGPASASLSQKVLAWVKQLRILANTDMSPIQINRRITDVSFIKADVSAFHLRKNSFL